MKSFTNKLSKLFALALVTILTLGTNIAFADSNIANGRYTLTNDTKYLDNNEIGDSMARSYTDKSMTLEKKDGQIYYTVGLSGAQYMNNHRIFVNGKSASIQKVAENTSAGTLKLKFKVDNPSDTILVKFYVDPMGRDVEYQLIPNLNSLSLVESYEEAKVESTTTQKEETAVEKEVESTTTPKEETVVEEEVENTTTSKEEATVEKEQTEQAKADDTISEEKQEPEVVETAETSVKESSKNTSNPIIIICIIVILAAIIIFTLYKRKK